jgi:signal transduction histidine kinase
MVMTETPSAHSSRDAAAVFKVTLAIWLSSIVAFSAYLIIGSGGAFPPWGFVWVAILPVLGIPLSWIIYRAAQALSGRTVMSRWLILTPVIAAVCAVQSVGDTLVHRVVRQAFGAPVPAGLDLEATALNFLIYLWLFAMYAVAVDLIAMTSTARAHEREAAEARELVKEAQLEVLRFQLNPHFLFNTLNNISSLVITGRNDQAEVMIARLSRFLRTVLDAEGSAMVPLHAELASVEAYLDIEAARFTGHLAVTIDCPVDLSSSLTPCLILQPLVENAIKYAVTPSQGAASIHIEVRREGDDVLIAVQDSGAVSGVAPAGAWEAGHGIGLRNVRNRLGVLYGGDAGLVTRADETGFRAEIRFPHRPLALDVAA